ncbi:85/88 kDa calcium-independent phospholipase A2-like isoform X2 [Penaeus japonicus]|uniref:85/88 kDa calcium-independent phospholipase A2-like isoform X2 n=1 Tax=Penaeus japonicus TaxID=27405 RepID=UPI001C71095E|nr:85/88 kDa calcium-independent phospholipase A2-like isoform X2 [Penaeus japonicus]
MANLVSSENVNTEASLQGRMSQFFGKLARGLGWGPQPTKVNNVNWSDYANRAFTVVEGMFIIIPLAEDDISEDPNLAFELIIHKEINNSRNAYSLLRTCTEAEAKQAYEAYSKILSPLVESCGKEVLCQSVLQKVLDFLRDHPSWHVGHIISHFGFLDALKNEEVQGFLNVPEDGEGLYPIHVAVENENEKVITALIAAGAELDVVDKSGNTPLHVASSKSITVIQALKMKFHQVLNKKNKAQETPLLLAAQCSKLDNIKHLIQLGANINHKDDFVDQSNQSYWEKIEKLVQAKDISSKDLHKGGNLLHWVKTRELTDLCLDIGCDPDLRNSADQTPLHIMVLRNRIQCIVTLLCRGAKANFADVDGMTPLHLAAAQCSPTLVQAFIVFGGEINVPNKSGETPRHLAASCNDKTKATERDRVIYLLHTVGSKRCQMKLSSCSDGCLDEGSFNGVPLYEKPLLRSRWIMDEKLCNKQISDSIRWQVTNCNGSQRTGRVLCLDGGGIKGLVMTQMLFVIQEVLGKPIRECFDWISGTSTGGFLALMLCTGKSVQDVQSLYYNLKEKVFVGGRPYEAGPLEDILIKEFGKDTVMSNIKSPRVMVTSTLADRLPPDLHLFRNYESPMSVLGVQENSVFMSTQPPEKQKIWLAARCSGAAPTYFRYCEEKLIRLILRFVRSGKYSKKDDAGKRTLNSSTKMCASEKFLDGGLVGNNPVLDTLTEIEEWNVAVRAQGRESEVFNPTVVVSLGCGKPPVMLVDTVDVTMPSILDVRRGFTAMYNLFNVMVEQACSSEGRIVDRARMWCSNLHVPFFRFNPQLSQEIALDEHDDECLVRMMWETRAYMKAQAKTLNLLKPLLVGPEDGPVPPPRQVTPSCSPSKLKPRISVSSSTSQDIPDTPHSLLSEGTSPDEDGSYHSTNLEPNAPATENTGVEEHPQHQCYFNNVPSSEASSSPDEVVDNVEDSESSEKISVASLQTAD